MNELFENLTADALLLADDELAHIAETAELSGEEHSRIMHLAKIKAGFVHKIEFRQPVKPKKRLKRLPALIAAAVTAALCATFGVSAYINRNSDMLQSFFGTDGETRIVQAELPAPMQYAYDNACFTVETVLNDGFSMIALIHCETPDGTPYRYYRNNVMHFAFADGSSPSDLAWNGLEIQHLAEDHPDYYAFQFRLTNFAEGETVYLTFPEIYEKMANADALDLRNVQIPISNIQNLTPAAFVSDTGEQILLSGFEMIYNTAEPPANPMQIDATLILQDDSRHVMLPSVKSSAEQMVTENGQEFWRNYKAVSMAEYTATDPDAAWLDLGDQIGFINVDEVKAIELEGVLYTRAE